MINLEEEGDTRTANQLENDLQEYKKIIVIDAKMLALKNDVENFLTTSPGFNNRHNGQNQKKTILTKRQIVQKLLEMLTEIKCLEIEINEQYCGKSQKDMIERQFKEERLKSHEKAICDYLIELDFLN